MKRLKNSPDTKPQRRVLRRNQTDAERKLWSILRRGQMSVKFFRQYSVGPYILDFYCPKRNLGIELDGSQHGEVPHKIYDMQRTRYLAQHRINVLRFWNDEVLTNLEGVWQRIREEIDRSAS